MSKGTEEIAAALEEAIAGDVETSTTLDATETTASVEKGTKSKTGDKGPIPYERFAEIVQEKNTFKEQLTALEAEKNELSKSLQQAMNTVSAAQSDIDTLNRVRAASRASDDRVVQAVDLLDKYLKGELEEIAEDPTLTTDEVSKKTQDLLKRTQQNLNEQHADLRADLIVQRADALADKWLGALPDAYGQVDRDILGDLWANSVDWDAIENNPDILDQELASKFQAAIDRYGVPRGALLNPDDVEFVEETTTPEPPTPEEELRELIGNKDYSLFKTVKTPTGKETLRPAVGDDEFAADMAKALKLANRR